MNYKELNRANCPECNSMEVKKNGYYSCKDGTIVAKYFCKMCHNHFSAQHEASDKYERKKDIMDQIITLHQLGFSIRKIAEEIGVAKKTVERKLKKKFSGS